VRAHTQVSLALGSQLDLMATFAELADVELPNKTLDSFSLVFSSAQPNKRYVSHHQYLHCTVCYGNEHQTSIIDTVWCRYHSLAIPVSSWVMGLAGIGSSIQLYN